MKDRELFEQKIYVDEFKTARKKKSHQSEAVRRNKDQTRAKNEIISVEKNKSE